jgi:hypothetical protein
LYMDTYPSNGGIKISGTKLTYTPVTSFSGNDTLTWYVTDNWGAVSDTATLRTIPSRLPHWAR